MLVFDSEICFRETDFASGGSEVIPYSVNMVSRLNSMNRPGLFLEAPMSLAIAVKAGTGMRLDRIRNWAVRHRTYMLQGFP